MAKREADEEKKIQKCGKCGEWKSFEEFAKHKRMAYGIDTTCKECTRARAENHYKNNAGQKKEYQIQYYKEHRLERLEYSKEYKEINKDRLNEWFREYEKDPRRVLSRSISRARRRSKIKEFATNITAEFLSNLWEETNTCEICGKELSNKKEAHLDHILPLCIGGEHMTHNVRYVCADCNLTRPKDGRDLIEEGIKNENKSVNR